MRRYERQNKPSETIEVPEEETIVSESDWIETLVPGLSKTEYEAIRSKAHEEAKSKRHDWRMKGRGRLVCTSCSVPHTSYVPTNLILVGIDEATGNPLLKTID